MRVLLTVLALFAFAAPAAATSQNSLSGVELYKMCASKYDTDYGFCAGYVSAVANLLESESVAGFRACNLGIVRSQQFVDIFKAYAETFSGNLNAEANAVVAASLARAFPCHQ